MTSNVPSLQKNEPQLLAIALSGCMDSQQLEGAPDHLSGFLSPLVGEPSSLFKGVTPVVLEGSQASRGRILREKARHPMTLISGVAQWSQDQAFLVPDDAFDLNDPTSLVALNGWPGTVVLDLWVDGDIEAFAAWLQAEGPANLIACLYPTKEKYSKTQVPGKNLFCQLWGLALSGEPASLENEKLTLSSLCAYLKGFELPVICKGEFVLADYSAGLFDPLGLGCFPIRSMGIKAERICMVKDVLSEIKHWSRYSESQLEYSVNHNLAPYLLQELGETAVVLRQTLGLRPQEIEASDQEISFSSGRLSYEFTITHKKAGLLASVLWLDPFWFHHPDRIKAVVEALSFSSTAILFILDQPVEPKLLVSSFQAKGWELTQETDDLVVAQKAKLEVKLEPELFEIIGHRLEQLFCEPANGQGLKEILALLGPN